MEKKAKRYIIRGKVQGVGFRYFTKSKGQELGVTGWVKNEKDGAVQCAILGDENQHKKFYEILNCGPSLSQVDSVEICECTSSELSFLKDFRDFQVLV